MKIWLKLTKGPPFFIPVPNLLLGLVLSKGWVKAGGFDLPAVDGRLLRHELARMKKRHRGMPLVEVRCAGGEHIRILP